jgi:hypothetical protein
VQRECDENKMPYDEEYLDNKYTEIVKYINMELKDKLANMLSVANLVELRNDFEKRFKKYFKSIKELNFQHSETHCLE